VETSTDDTPDRPHNAELIAGSTGVTPLCTLPFVPGADPDALADALAARLAPSALLALLGRPALPAP
jgi:hypothetical protein